MKIEFFGVRGSIASPGPETARVGGNTSSVLVTCGTTKLLLDAGTGLRGLGDRLLAEAAGAGVEATLLLSHVHWDHIQGLPFFAPLYVPNSRLTIVGAPGDVPLRDTLVRQMSAPVFPVRLDDTRAALDTRALRLGEPLALDGGAIVVRAAKLNHPGGVFAYRIEYGGRSLVYATDTEHYACVDPELRRLADGADILVYDAQYTPEEYGGEVGPSKVGWGHSTYADGVAAARAAGVGQLVLFHHDPRRTDDGVFAIEARARAVFPSCVAACEGMILDLGARSPNREVAA
jgi:phosphoribosyl 1,2-cyclic phosphodiesterase